jgi:hypothetical protein
MTPHRSRGAWHAPAGAPPPLTVSPELAHSSDLLPTILGYASIRPARELPAES